MYEYKVKYEGLVVIKIDGVRYKAAKNHPTLPDTLELPKEVQHENLELVGKSQLENRVIKKKNKGE